MSSPKPGAVMASTATETDELAYGRILDAARRLFLTNGYPATSMGMIAREAGVVRSTVYNNFADKQAILGVLMREYLRGYATIPERINRSSPPEQTSFELIEAVIREAFMWRLENAALRPLIDISSHLSTSGWNEANAAADTEIRNMLLNIHRRDAERGLLRGGVDINFATYALYGMIEAVLSSFDVNTEPKDVAVAIRHLALLHWHAIYAVSPEVPPPPA
jgi:AcrR family transcriptional regulator